MKSTIKPINYTLISKKGIKDLKSSISQLKIDERKILQELRDIDRKFGHDEQLIRNEKLVELDMIKTEIFEKSQLLKTAKPIPRKRSRLEVALGSVVDLIDRRGKKIRFTIVDSVEANPIEGKISTKSPLGQSLVGHSVRDIIKWNSKDKTYRLKLIRIN